MVISVEIVERWIKWLEEVLKTASEAAARFIKLLLNLLYKILNWLKEQEFEIPTDLKILDGDLPDPKMSIFFLFLFFFLWWYFEKKPIPYTGNPPKPGTYRNELLDIYPYSQKLIKLFQEWFRRKILGKHAVVCVFILQPQLKRFFRSVKRIIRTILYGPSKGR